MLVSTLNYLSHSVGVTLIWCLFLWCDCFLSIKYIHVYMCTHACMYICCACMCTDIMCECMHVYMLCMHVYWHYVWVHACIHVVHACVLTLCVSACMYTCCACMCTDIMCECMHVYMLCMHVYWHYVWVHACIHVDVGNGLEILQSVQPRGKLMFLYSCITNIISSFNTI